MGIKDWPKYFIQWLESAHSARMRYLASGIGVTLMEVYLSYRAAYAAFIFFFLIGGQEAAWTAAAFVFIGAFITGFVLASHPTSAAEVRVLWKIPWLLITVIAADWTGVIYLVYEHTGLNDNPVQASLAASFCLLALSPFGLGKIMEKAQKAIASEQMAHHENRVSAFTFDMEQRAMTHLRARTQEDPTILAHYLPQRLKGYTQIVLGEGKTLYPNDVFPETSVLHDTTMNAAIGEPERIPSYDRQPTEEHKIIPLRKVEEQDPLANGG